MGAIVSVDRVQDCCPLGTSGFRLLPRRSMVGAHGHKALPSRSGHTPDITTSTSRDWGGTVDSMRPRNHRFWRP